jgi:hypothetical protein
MTFEWSKSLVRTKWALHREGRDLKESRILFKRMSKIRKGVL